MKGSQQQETQKFSIDDAIFDKFNVEKLTTAFAQGAAVNNDFSGYNKPTLYCVVNEMRNNELQGQVLDTNNLKNFFSVLSENGMQAPANLSPILTGWGYADRESLVLDLLGRVQTKTASIQSSKSEEVQSLKESGRDNSSGGAGIY